MKHKRSFVALLMAFAISTSAKAQMAEPFIGFTDANTMNNGRFDLAIDKLMNETAMPNYLIAPSHETAPTAAFKTARESTTMVAVPEPATAAMIGLTILGMLRRRRAPIAPTL